MGRKYIKIDKEIESVLYKFIETSRQAREKRRAMAILLNSQKVSVYNIAEKLGVNKDVVYDWIIKFTNFGIKGLQDKPIPGRPKKIKAEHQEVIKEVLKKSSER